MSNSRLGVAGLLTLLAVSLGTAGCRKSDSGGAESDTTTVAPAAPAAPTAAAPAVAPAPDTAPAALEDPLTLRPGDRITWTPSAPHRVQFGGTITFSGGELKLPPFADISKVLTDFDPALTPDANGMAVAAPGQKVTARVRDDAAQSGLASIFFTCGVVPHRPIMVTRDFPIAPASADHPARTLEIGTVGGPFAWVLKTAQGDVRLTRQ